MDKLRTGPFQPSINETGGFAKIKNDNVLFKWLRICKLKIQVGNIQSVPKEKDRVRVFVVKNTAQKSQSFILSPGDAGRRCVCCWERVRKRQLQAGHFASVPGDLERTRGVRNELLKCDRSS